MLGAINPLLYRKYVFFYSIATNTYLQSFCEEGVIVLLVWVF